ncbi:MAG TPA: Gfo/Idh/MocA family oxidoreductase [Solirubrobacteraceae bacterium]|nr:Gfo/Idh/MocA family oxidoreductase [Solirubrobacteraceae bacterium]
MLQIGVGGFGAVWLDALAELRGEAGLDGLVDVAPGTLAAAAARAGVPEDRCFTDVDAALAANGADLALVVVPPEAHRPVAVRCLEAGLPVLVEKPLAGSRDDSFALVAAADRSGLELAVSQNYRYRPVIETARRVLASGRLGAIGQARIEFRHHHDFRGTFRQRMDDPLLLDMAVHHFDLIRFVTGLEPRAVAAHSWNPPWSQFAGDASAVCVFAMDTGARVVYEASWHPRVQDTDWNCRWLVECERGYLTLDRDRVAVGERADPHAVPEPAEADEVPLVDLGHRDQAAMLIDFMRALRAGEAAPTTAADNLRSLEMVFAAVESAHQGREIPLSRT